MDSVTTATYDLNKVLLEGSNFVFLEALGDDKNYLDSDASFIQVEYTRYSPEKFKDAVKAIYSDNRVEISDTDIDETIDNQNFAKRNDSNNTSGNEMEKESIPFPQ